MCAWVSGSCACSWGSLTFCWLGLLSLTSLPFPKERQRGVDLDERGGGKELRREEGRETVIRLYCMRKEFMFNKRKNWSVVVFLIK